MITEILLVVFFKLIMTKKNVFQTIAFFLHAGLGISFIKLSLLEV